MALSEAEHQLDSSDFGRPGIEKAAGYQPMEHAVPDPDPEPALSEKDLAHFTRPPEADFGLEVERAYFDVDGSGRRRDETETVEKDRAADDLKAIRQAEHDARERELDEATAAAVDDLRRQVTEQPQPQQQQDPQQPQSTEAAEQPQPEHDYERAQATIAEADQKIAEFLKDPFVRERVEREFAGVQQQAATQVQEAQTAYQHAVQQNALVGLAVLNSAFPELQGLHSPEAINGALRVMRPERAEQYRQYVGQISTLVESYQRQAGAVQQQQLEQQAHQYLQRAQELEQFKAAEDKKFDAATANESPETMKHIRENSFAMLETHYGIPQARMRALASGKERMDSTALIQSSEFQRILVDAFKFRMSQAAVRNAANRPVPQVQRPGVSEPVKADPAEISAALARFNREGGNIGRDGLRNAAAIVAARRARS